MKRDNRTLIQLPFDQYQRYKIAEEIINELRDKKRMKILDVGGNPGILKKFLPNDNVFILDLEKGKGKHFISGNALRLPFPNKSFDVVVSVDVFEHIPLKDKEKFLKEELRVSKRINIIATPCYDKELALAEKIVCDFIYVKYNIRYKFLEEHFKNKLPDLNATINFIKNRHFDCVWVNNGYLYNWLFMMLLNFHFEWMDSTKSILKKVNEFYNRNFYNSDNRVPSYRKVIVVSKDRKVNLENIVEKYKPIEENEDEKLYKIGLANLLMRTIETDELRKREDEIRKSDESYKEKIRVLNEWNITDKKRREDEMKKITKRSDKEIRRLNEEIKKLHASYSKQIDRLSEDKEKITQTLSKEIDRLNKEIESLHRSYSHKSKDAESEKERTVQNLSQEIDRLNSEIQKLHSIYSMEISRLNKEIRDLHQSYTQKINELAR